MMSTVVLVRVGAVMLLVLCAIAAKSYIPRIRENPAKAPGAKLKEGVIAGGLIGGFIAAGIVLSNSTKDHAVADPQFVTYQAMIIAIFVGVGMLFGSIRVLNT